jgi:endoglycosylceramidase
LLISTQACSEGFQFIYNNTNGALEKWAQFWVVLAQRIGRDQPAVLGYEWINEPWVGDFCLDPPLILPANAGRLNLLPCYDYLNEVVRRYECT